MSVLTYILSFQFTSNVNLLNITILGSSLYNNNVVCSSVISNRSIVVVSNSNFVGITGTLGAAICSLNSLIILNGTNTFIKNNASSGGAMYSYQSTVLFSGNNSFLGNAATRSITTFGLTVCDLEINLLFDTQKNTGGGAIYCVRSNFSNHDCSILLSHRMRSTVVGDGLSYYKHHQHCFYSRNNSYLLFANNSAKGTRFTSSGSGGALFIKESSLISFSSISCKSNSATLEGGAIKLIGSSMHILENVFMVNNNATVGGAIKLIKSSMHISGNISMANNDASEGGAINLSRSLMHISGKCNVSIANNNASIGGAINIENSNILLSSDNITFTSNRATSAGGAIASRDSSYLDFSGNVTFNNNMAYIGGAICVNDDSKLILKSVSIYFIKNTAKKHGGAIYYLNSKLYAGSYCHLHLCECLLSFNNSLENTSLIFVNNYADSGGSVVYSGQHDLCDLSERVYTKLDVCKMKIGKEYDDRNLMQVLLNISMIGAESMSNQIPIIAHIEEVQFCNQQYGHFSQVARLRVYPGEKFNVTLAAIGQANLSVVSTNIKSSDLDDKNNGIVLMQVKHFIEINNTCTDVSYYVKATSIKNESKTVTARYKLYHRNPCDSLVDGAELIVDVKPCPLGFQLSSKEKTCDCSMLLQAFTQRCDINALTFKRMENSFWISKPDNDDSIYRLIVHKGGCPFQYCKEASIDVPLSNSDDQCDFNRKGTLCGQCKDNYSIALGTLHCIDCSNSYNIALIIPFALAGIMLVVLILLLHFTVDSGTLSGLIFYANIVHSNRQAFSSSFHARESNVILLIFISWLNLDFGIETCFFDGMDIYTYSWLQFVFPFYIWFLIGIIIVAYRYSKRMAKILGQNPVAALATLLFVSYGKMLNAIITPLSLTQLMYTSDNRPLSTQFVWLYDGSIKYFKDPKHITLGVFATIILVVIFLPYTFLLLCGHWLIAYSNKCFLSWLNRIKPFMDVYYAPFKRKSRYWIGLMLVSRLVLLLIIAINAVDSERTTILVIASVTAGLLFIKGKVYEQNYNDILESSFLFNLCVFSIANLYIKDKSSHIKYALSSASITVALLTFIGILIFHIYLLIKSTKFWREWIAQGPLVCKNRLLSKLLITRGGENIAMNNDVATVTSTIVELREPLIEVDNL